MLEYLDRALFAILNRGAANGFLDRTMPIVTSLHKQGWFLTLLVLACIAALWKGGRRARIWFACAVIAIGLSDGIAYRVIKRAAPRLRPCQRMYPGGPMTVPTARLLLLSRKGDDCPGSPSFPSNHAANTMALAVVGWWFTRRRARWLWFIIPLVVGYSRIYLGYHYPSDVVGGWIIGGLIATLTVFVAERYWKSDRDLQPNDERTEPPISVA